MGKKAISGILIAFLFSAADPCKGGERTASWLLAACQGVLNASPAPDGGYSVDSDVNAGQCMGTLETVVQLASLYGPDGKRALPICVEPGITISDVQLAQIFNGYVQQNPSQLSEPASFVVELAFARAYPCKAP